MLRKALIKAGQSEALHRQVSSRKLSRRVAMRFVAGETLSDGLQVTRELAGAGMTVTLDYLGESVSDEATARASAKVILEALAQIGEERLPAGVSVKPTAVGLTVAEDLCQELVAEIAAAAARVGGHVTLDMEDSSVTERTIALVELLQEHGHDVGCAVQSYLRRTFRDCERLSRAQSGEVRKGSGGASLRLCKGAYLEPATTAYQHRTEVDLSFAECAAYLLAHGTYPRIATHDHRLIDFTQRSAARLGLGRDDFEFQMLYGVRPSLQDQLVADGYRLCVYVPFGEQWYPYFMRRLAERPANVAFFLRSLRDT